MPYSKRKYPERQCGNPACMNGGRFIPHDKRQRYCDSQCATDASNDRRKERNNTIYANEKELKAEDRKLAKLYARYYREKQMPLHKIYFDHEEVNLALSVEQSTNTVTGGQVRWLYEYGTEICSDKDYFLIHKRNLK